MQPGTTSAFKQPSDPNICSGTNYLWRWNELKKTKNCLQSIMWLEKCLSYDWHGNWDIFLPDIVTKMEWWKDGWKLVDRNDTWCEYYSKAQFLALSQFSPRSEIKCGISLGNVTWLNTKQKMKLHSKMTPRGSWNENMHQNFFFSLFWHHQQTKPKKQSCGSCDVSHFSHFFNLKSLTGFCKTKKKKKNWKNEQAF